MAAGEGKQFTGILRVVDELLRGNSLSTHQIAEVAGVEASQARKYVKYLKDNVTGVIDDADGLRLNKPILVERASPEAVVGASLMSGMSRLFDGTKYAEGIRQVLNLVTSQADQPTSTNEFARKFVFAVRGGDPAIRDRPRWLDQFIDAILRQITIDIDYVSFDGQPHAERVDPLSLLVYEHQLYIVVRDSRGCIEKPRRFSRIRGVEQTRQHFAYPSIAEYAPAQELAEVWGVFLGFARPAEDVMIKFSELHRTFVSTHHWHPTQKLIDPEKLVLKFHLRPCPEFERWILGFGPDAEVISPPWLREAIAARATAMARRYATIK